MRREMRTYEYECDFCGKTELIAVSSQWYTLPEGWKRITVKAADKFATDRDACETCAKKRPDIIYV